MPPAPDVKTLFSFSIKVSSLTYWIFPFSFPVPDNDTNVDLYRIRVVDMRLSFRSKKEFYKSEASGNKLRLVKALGNRTQSYTDRFLRDSVVVSIHTRNIGG